MLGDTAVAVHPDDERYRHLIGTEVELPLTGRRIPIVADEHVDPEFGTGAVKVTPAHDPNDFEIGQRHDLPIADDHGRARRRSPRPARSRASTASRRAPRSSPRCASEGRIVAEKRPYVHSVGHCSRCDTVGRAAAVAAVVRQGRAAGQGGRRRGARRPGRDRPAPSWRKRYFDWVDNMHDWCISRQLWWGHRIPVWYGPDGEVVCVGPDERAADRRGLDARTRTSSTPGSPRRCGRSRRWAGPSDTDDLREVLPDQRAGHRLRHPLLLGRPDDDVRPVRDGRRRRRSTTVALHGLVRDQFGKKMSKSCGNVGRPAGLDGRVRRRRGALHRWPAAPTPAPTCRSARSGSPGSRNFCNKLWNATRFALMNGATVDGELPPPTELSAADRWILSRLQRGRSPRSTRSTSDYEFAKVVRRALPLRLGRGLRLVRRAGQAAAGRGRRGRRRDPAGARRGARRAAAAAAPGRSRSSPRTLWTALTGGESVVIADWPAADPARARRRRPRRRSPRCSGRHRGPPVPLRPGPQAGPAGRRPG